MKRHTKKRKHRADTLREFRGIQKVAEAYWRIMFASVERKGRYLADVTRAMIAICRTTFTNLAGEYCRTRDINRIIKWNAENRPAFQKYVDELELLWCASIALKGSAETARTPEQMRATNRLARQINQQLATTIAVPFPVL